ncbi:hypothetical protein Sinac_4669 [Singulisphaera acidiphila DSM 18658]|uniref:Uncharacterized protein n=1 Tax=Singulisphaera acidiphila (strain ATCC BAA-1392 / DSM 18658 / VKM B-2454 / MOB10) TaxID=886293 RepID=L0DJK8_SINAD|nr:hypothetical protein Sinac_4669 [Singulisphaera acidiphila DSM 18658]
MLQDRGEQRILLEAVAPTAVADQLGLQARQVEPDRSAEMDVEVLERDPGEVVQWEAFENLRRRRTIAGVTDAVQVGVDVNDADVGGGRIHASDALLMD